MQRNITELTEALKRDLSTVDASEKSMKQNNAEFKNSLNENDEMIASITNYEKRQIQLNSELKEIYLNTPDSDKVISNIIQKPMHKLNDDELFILKEVVKNIDAKLLLNDPKKEEIFKLGTVVNFLQGDQAHKSTVLRDISEKESFNNLYQRAKQSGHLLLQQPKSPSPGSSPSEKQSRFSIVRSASPIISRLTRAGSVSRTSSSPSLSRKESGSPSPSPSPTFSRSVSPPPSLLKFFSPESPPAPLTVDQVFEKASTALHKNLEKNKPAAPTVKGP